MTLKQQQQQHTTTTNNNSKINKEVCFSDCFASFATLQQKKTNQKVLFESF